MHLKVKNEAKKALKNQRNYLFYKGNVPPKTEFCREESKNG
ncbi:hypothetical protein [Pseudomonas putida]|nr:hypothetical protein [Pseudomonas putida]